MVQILDNFFARLQDFLITAFVFLFLAVWVYTKRTGKTFKDLWFEIKDGMEKEKE